MHTKLTIAIFSILLLVLDAPLLANELAGQTSEILNWTDADKKAAALAAKKVQDDLNAAIKAGRKEFQVPPGNYLNWDKTLAALTIAGAKDMHIDATGSVFYKEGRGAAVLFESSARCEVKGLTVDMFLPPFIQGEVSEIIKATKPDAADQIILTLEKGYIPANLATRQNNIGRGFLADANGTIYPMPAVFGVLYGADNAPGKWTWIYKRSSPEERGPQLGDSVALHMPGGGGGIIVNNCDSMRFYDATVYSSGIFCVWESGQRSPGGNYYKRLKIIKRPGTSRLGAGAKDGFHSMSQARGPTIEDSEISRVCDDGMNIHGFINVVVKKLADDKYVLAGLYGRDYDIGTELLLLGDTTMKPLTRCKVVAWEPFNQTEGLKLYGEMQKYFLKKHASSLRGTIEPFFGVVTLDEKVNLDIGDQASSKAFDGNGVTVRNLYMHDHCNRGLLLRASNALIENCRFENIMWGGVYISSSLVTYLEGGVPDNVRITGNTFTNCSSRTFFAKSPILWGSCASLSILGSGPPKKTEEFMTAGVNRYYSNIEVKGNTFVDSPGLPILIANVDNAKVYDNVFVRPFQDEKNLPGYNLTAGNKLERKFTPAISDVSDDLMKNPIYAILLISSSNVQVYDNRLQDAPAWVKGVLGIGPWCNGIELKKAEVKQNTGTYGK